MTSANKEFVSVETYDNLYTIMWKKPKRNLTIAILVIAIFGATMYYLGSSAGTSFIYTQTCNALTTTKDCESISLATSTWRVFENTTYGYAISYPLEGNVSTSEDYGNPAHILFSIPGRFMLVGVDATLYPNSPSSISENLDLKSYAEGIRALQINDQNPYVKDRKIGGLTETWIDGRKAYQFVLDKAFTTGYSGMGYLIPDGEVYMYIITENAEGQKIIIYYFLGNPIAEAMCQTFRLNS